MKTKMLIAATSIVALIAGFTHSACIAETVNSSATMEDWSGQHFVPDVIGAFNGLSPRADALAFRRGSSPQASLCKHYQGIARKDGPDGTPYLFLTKSGNVPWFCEIHDGDDEHGFLIVVKMGSRGKHGERLGRNLYPYNDSEIPLEDRAVTSIALDGQDGRPGYRHPGGMQIVGDVLAIGAENRVFASHPRAAILFFDISDPEAPKFITQFVRPFQEEPNNEEFGADPLALTAIRAPGGGGFRYVMMVAGGDGNRDVRFYRSLPNNPDGNTTNLKSPDLDWEEIGRYTGTHVTLPTQPPVQFFLSELNCSGTTWPTGLGTQHQNFNFVREGDLDGQLYLVAMMRDGSVVNPLADEDEFIDLYKVNLTPDGQWEDTCPLTFVSRKRVGLDGLGPALQSWGNFVDVGSMAAGSGVHVTPSGELLVYVTDHRTTIFGEYRYHSLVRPDSPTLRPTASINGPFVVDEGSSVELTGSAEAPITKAFVQLFSSTGAGLSLNDGAWLTVEFQDRDLDHFDDLCRLNLGNFQLLDPCVIAGLDPIWDRVSSLRWFAPPGCTIQANDYPIRSGEFPGPDTVLLRGTGAFEEVLNLSQLRVFWPSDTQSPWPATPVPEGKTGEGHNFNNDIEGVTFYEAYRVNGALILDHRGCEAYYSAQFLLGWDFDNDGVFEASGTSATFSAAQLDGPALVTVFARAQHPRDSSVVGTGVPVPVQIEVRNVPPVIQSASVTDLLGYDLEGGARPALVGLPIQVAVAFTDPGLADTQTAAIDWGDGTLDTSFDQFTDAHNGATGQLRHSHVYTAPGSYQVAVTITDDDGGATSVEFVVAVLSLEDAIKWVAEDLARLISEAETDCISKALQAALDELIGNLGGTPPTNGAIDKLDENDPVSAITKLRAAILQLITAESCGAGDLSFYKDLLGLVAESIATGAYYQAQTAVDPPSRGQARNLETIARLINEGHQHLVNRHYSNACDSFRQATERAINML
jgi:hypothetical protein